MNRRKTPDGSVTMVSQSRAVGGATNDGQLSRYRPATASTFPAGSVTASTSG